jgi:hypothetical protein
LRAPLPPPLRIEAHCQKKKLPYLQSARPSGQHDSPLLHHHHHNPLEDVQVPQTIALSPHKEGMREEEGYTDRVAQMQHRIEVQEQELFAKDSLIG